MAIPMKLSSPLGLYLSRPTTQTRLEVKAKVDIRLPRSITADLSVILRFGRLLRVLYEHPDWSQIHEFCTQRYTTSDILSNNFARILRPPESLSSSKQNSVIVDFNTDPASIGLPSDFSLQLAKAVQSARGFEGGESGLSFFIASALTVGIGAAAYMDLIYSGSKPGETPHKKTHASIAQTKKGGRGRSAKEWEELWSVLSDWIYLYEVVLEGSFGTPTSMAQKAIRIGEGNRIVPTEKYQLTRRLMESDTLHGADSIQSMFSHLHLRPVEFQGIEWDFLRLEADPDVEVAFKARFGPPPTDWNKLAGDMTRDVGPEFYYDLGLKEVSPNFLRPCPTTTHGAAWERWFLSIEGGCVIPVDTVFQALWATMLLTYLPLHIRIIDRDSTFPRFPDTDCVYL